MDQMVKLDQGILVWTKENIPASEISSLIEQLKQVDKKQKEAEIYRKERRNMGGEIFLIIHEFLTDRDITSSIHETYNFIEPETFILEEFKNLGIADLAFTVEFLESSYGSESSYVVNIPRLELSFGLEIRAETRRFSGEDEHYYDYYLFNPKDRD